MGTIKAVCLSEKKGTAKTDMGKATLAQEHGLEGDAHAGGGLRQVSMLALEKIDAFRAKGATVNFGDFGENLVVEGIDFATLPLGTQFRSGDILLELSQIGKKCNNPCDIYYRMGECIMPQEGVFVRVLQGGVIQTGDEIHVA